MVSNLGQRRPLTNLLLLSCKCIVLSNIPTKMTNRAVSGNLLSQRALEAIHSGLLRKRPLSVVRPVTWITP